MGEQARKQGFMRRVQMALGMSAMDMAHELDLSLGEYEELANAPRSHVVAGDPIWPEIVKMLNRRIGGCTAMLSEVNTMIAGRAL